MKLRERLAEWKEIERLCEMAHDCGKWGCMIPWSPNNRVVHLESISDGMARFSTYAPYVESWGRIAGSFHLPLEECSVGKIEEEAELNIGFAMAEATQLTRLPPTLEEAFDLYMKPQPADSSKGGDIRGGAAGTGLGPAIQELLGGDGGPAFGPTSNANDRDGSIQTFARPRVPDGDVKEREGKKLHTTYDKEVYELKLTAEEEEAVREWLEARVFQAEDGNEFVEHALRCKAEMLRVTGWTYETAEPIMEPGFVKSAEDEKKWQRAKEIAKRQKGVDEPYALANHIFHKMKGEATVDHISTGNPDNPKESGGGVVPDNELQRTNTGGVAVSEFASAGQIDPDKAKDYVERLYNAGREALGDLGGKAGMTQFDEYGVQVESYQDRMLLTVKCNKTAAEALEKLLTYVKQTGGIGHSFSIVVDPDDSEYRKTFGFDGDGPDRIIDIKTKKIDEDASDTAFDQGHADGSTGNTRQLPDEWYAYAMGYRAGEEKRLSETLFTVAQCKAAYHAKYGDRDPREVFREIAAQQEAELGNQGEPEREASEKGTKSYTTAVAVIVKNYRYVLLGKAKDSGDDREGMWVFPGGGIDPEDGNDPSKAAQREAFEEMGILVTPMTEILTHPDKPGVAFVMCVYSDDQDPYPNKEFSQWMWLDHARRHEQEGIYPQNRSILDRIPERYLKRVAGDYSEAHRRFDVALALAEDVLGETAALKRQKDNKRAFAVSSKRASVAKGKSAEPNRRSKAGSTDKTKDSPTDQAVAATQNIKAKKTLSTPPANQDSAEKLHFTGGANPRKAAGDAMTDLERQKQGRDPAALKPGDAGKEGKADAEKKAKEQGAAPAKPGAAQALPGGAPSDALIKAAQAVLAAAGKAPASAPAAKPASGEKASQNGNQAKTPDKKSAEGSKGSAQPAQAAQGAPAPAGAPAAPQAGAAQPAAPQAGQPASGAQGAGQPTADASPASQGKKDAQTQAASPGAQNPSAGQPPAQTAAQTATPPGQVPQPAQGQQAQGAQFSPPQQPQPGQPVDPNQPQAMPQGQPGLVDPNTPPGMQPAAQGMPAFQPRTVDLVLKDRKNAEKMFRWLQTMGFQQVSTPDGTTVQAVVNSHEDMNIINRTAKAFGLELSGITP